jgi:Fe2+/Zn2+ uptake regulation proteins
MNKMSHYKTKQKEALLNFIKSLNGQHVTVQQIAVHFETQGYTLGITTIYRHLDKLVSEGIVKKYILDGVSGSCFEYIGDPHSCNEHFHLKCEECGILIHLECKSLEKIYSHISESHGFAINSLKTIFYGRCPKCITG